MALTGHAHDKHGHVADPGYGLPLLIVGLAAQSGTFFFARSAFGPVQAVQGDASTQVRPTSKGNASYMLRVGAVECTVTQGIAEAITVGMSYRLYVTAYGKQFLAIEPIAAVRAAAGQAGP